MSYKSRLYSNDRKNDIVPSDVIKSSCIFDIDKGDDHYNGYHEVENNTCTDQTMLILLTKQLQFVTKSRALNSIPLHLFPSEAYPG